MTDRATLEALLARVVEGTGPDRELDLRIARELFDSEPLGHAAGMKDEMLLASNGWGAPMVSWPHYTTSLDAALTLVPEGWGWARTPQGDKVLVAVFIDIPLPDGSWKSEWIGETHADDKRALIAACLKARMEAQGE